MKKQRAYRFRIYPNKEQEKLIHKTFGCCRFVYNRMLSERKEIYEKTGKDVRLTPAKYKKEYVWLKEVDSLALANVQLNLEAAYQKFFKEEKGRVSEVQVKAQEQKKLYNECGERKYPPGEWKTASAQGGIYKDPSAQSRSGRVHTEICHSEHGK